jgi:type IV secretion system protein TrbL
MLADPHLAIPNPFPIDVVGSLVSAVGRALTVGAQSFASSMFARMTDALVATTAVRLDGWFDGPWRAMLAVAAVFALPILLVGVATEVLAGRLGQALRRGVLLPLLAGPLLLAARGLLALVLALVSGACALLVRVGVGGPAGYGQGLDRVRSLLGVSAGPGAAVAPGGGVGLLFVVLVAGLLAFVIWVELACRAALVVLLAAFVPLALAGLFWSETARWARRLVEVLAAVVLSQLVITVVMVLAAADLGHSAGGVAAGVDGLAVGLALLFLGSLGLPLTFRVVPHVVEAAVVAGGGAAAAARLRAGATQLLAAAPAPAARLASLPAAASPPGVGRSTLASGPGPAGPRGPRRPPGAPDADAARVPR